MMPMGLHIKNLIRSRKNMSVGPMLLSRLVVNMNLPHENISETKPIDKSSKRESTNTKVNTAIETSTKGFAKVGENASPYISVTTHGIKHSENIIFDGNLYLADPTYQKAKMLLGRMRGRDLNKINDNMAGAGLPSDATKEQKKAFKRGREYAGNQK